MNPVSEAENAEYANSEWSCPGIVRSAYKCATSWPQYANTRYGEYDGSSISLFYLSVQYVYTCLE